MFEIDPLIMTCLPDETAKPEISAEQLFSAVPAGPKYMLAIGGSEPLGVPVAEMEMLTVPAVDVLALLTRILIVRSTLSVWTSTAAPVHAPCAKVAIL